MTVDSNLIKTLERLSCLSFSESEVSEIQADLSKMINFVEKLNEPEVEEKIKATSMARNAIGLREDVVGGTVKLSDALKNAPQVKDEFFAVPKVIKK